MTAPGNQWSNETLQAEIVDAVGGHGAAGMTWAEVAEAFGIHHGTASGALSALHRQGHIARLTARRGGSRVYVTPKHILGRATETQGRPNLCASCSGEIA